MAVLVTGGTGYIGSVTVDLLREKGEDVVVLDDVARGHRPALDQDIPLYSGKTGDAALVSRIAREHHLDACVHFAALAYVGESVEAPARYFGNNVGEGMVLMDALLEAGVTRVVFSSSCATYGEPDVVPIPEDHPQWPKNPYGWSKLFLERILDSYDTAYGLRFVSLRYFNAAGATRRRGEHHDPETHLIPLVLQAAMGLRPHVSVFGNDYPTPDGSAIRDYIHVQDLASAHVLALEHLRAGGRSAFLNLGTGAGASVLEVIETARQVTGREVQALIQGRRPGDPARLVAQAGQARTLLGWTPQVPELAAIVRSAWEWHLAHPEGYGA